MMYYASEGQYLYKLGPSLKILELSFASFFHQLHFHMFLHNLFRYRVSPFPLEINSLTLLLSHQTYLVLFVLDHRPFLILASIHHSENGVVLNPSSQLAFGRIQVEGIFQLNGCFPAMLS